MVFEFKFPDVGEGMTEGKLVEWKVKEGDFVKIDQVVALMETAKAIVEMPSPFEGTVLKRNFKEGDMVNVGQTLLFIGNPGEKIETAKNEETPMAEKITATIKEVQNRKIESGILASPATRKIAMDLNIDLSKVKGSGLDGRILPEDIEAFSSAVQKNSLSKQSGLEERIPLTYMRKVIAEKMVKTASTVPHAVGMDEADVTKLFDLREKEKINAKNQGIHLTFMPFIMKALVHSLKKFPILNSSFDAEKQEIVFKKYCNIGFAVDTKDGLIVPVAKNVDSKTILEIALELQRLSGLAMQRKISLSDLQDSTFSITNFGSIGGSFSVPIINAPNAAILGIGRIEDKAMVKSGTFGKKIVAGKAMPLSLAFDHRLLDGATAVRFLNDLKEQLENPDLIAETAKNQNP